MPVKTKNQKAMPIEKLATIVKPFVESLKMKTAPSAVLKTALVNENYIIATDSHRLIRIKHNQEVQESYLHHFKKELTKDCSVNSYPQTDRLIPDTSNAQLEIKVNIVEWMEAHELGLVAAKEHRNRVIGLENGLFTVSAVETFINKKGKKEKKPDFDKIAFKYFLDENTGIEEKVAYNCEYMLDALKILKKLGHSQAKLYFYGKSRPMYFVAGDVEILISPIRTV